MQTERTPAKLGTENGTRWRALLVSTCVCIIVHTVAAFAMLFLLGNGLDTNADLHNRCQYITQNRTFWLAGWLCWNFSALAILAYFVAFVRAHDSVSSMILPVVLCIGSIAVANDLAAESVEMGLVPQLAQETLLSGVSTSFLAFHRLVVLLSGFAANSMYTLAVLLCVIAARRVYAGWITIAGFAVVLCGFAISVACVVGSVNGMFWSNALIVPLLVLWQSGVAHDAYKRLTIGVDSLPQGA